MFSIVCWSLLMSLVINMIMFAIAFKLRSDKLTDVSYALSFIVLALFAYSLGNKNGFTLVATAMVCFWALRIGGFLLYRVLHVGKDQRFDGVRDNFWLFGKFWLGQAITVWVLMIPVLLVFPSTRGSDSTVIFGVCIWLAGFILEVIADLQKYRFTHNPLHKDRWIDSGIWRYSRHPNYFGEMLVWFGIYIYSFSHFTLVEKIIGVVSPLLIISLLLFVSGIPILEKSADKRWGTSVSIKHIKNAPACLFHFRRRGSDKL